MTEATPHIWAVTLNEGGVTDYFAKASVVTAHVERHQVIWPPGSGNFGAGCSVSVMLLGATQPIYIADAIALEDGEALALRLIEAARGE